MLVGLTTGAWSCSASRAGTCSAGATSTLFRRAAVLALIVAVPVPRSTCRSAATSAIVVTERTSR